uniref:Si:ch73-335m24.2 n=1 Tax=Hippocampus comes TaxID=109280 RepID=A0A3Q2ZFX5_HIPCM
MKKYMIFGCTQLKSLIFFHFPPTVYLHSVLKNHTAHACEGETLTIECPARTSVAVLSAFFGRRVPQHYLCPSQKTNLTEDAECSSPKVLSECQDERSCQIPVLGPVFGHDPCPLTSKYLLVYYKCRPGRLVCENQRLRLACKNDTILAIYSATFGHLLHGMKTPQLCISECLSPSALRKVSRRCHGQANCSVLADTQTFGDPCFPGTRKHLRVSYTCGEKPTVILMVTLSCVNKEPAKKNKKKKHATSFQMPNTFEILVVRSASRSVYIRLHLIFVFLVPERVALYFVSGICAGLVFLLCLFGVHSTLVKDVKELVSDLHDELKAPSRQHKDLIEDLYDDDELSLSDFSLFHHLTQSYRTADVLAAPMLTMEMIAQGAEHSRDLHSLQWMQSHVVRWVCTFFSNHSLVFFLS